MESYVIYVIDTETTSINTEQGDVIEISAIRLIQNSAFQFEETQKTWCLRALNASAIEDEALKINGHKREDILGLTQFGLDFYKIPANVVSEIELWIQEDGVSAVDRIFAGQNPYFDITALQHLWRKVNSKETFPFSLERNNRIIDTKQLAAFIDVCNNKRRLRYDLSGLVKSFGIKKGKAHRASEDTKMTSDLLVKMITSLQVHVRESFGNSYLTNEGED